jgi:hypothetical protein
VQEDGETGAIVDAQHRGAVAADAGAIQDGTDIRGGTGSIHVCEKREGRAGGIKRSRDTKDVSRLPSHECGRSVLADIDGKACQRLSEESDNRSFVKRHSVNLDGIEEEIDEGRVHL